MSTPDETFAQLRRPSFDQLRYILKSQATVDPADVACRLEERNRIIIYYGWKPKEYLQALIAHVQRNVRSI